VIGWARRLWETLQRTRPLRAWTRYSRARGDILSAGVAYFAFFSVFPAVALGLVVLGVIATSHPDVHASLVSALGELLPGFVRSADNPNGVIAVTLPSTVAMTWTGVVAFVGIVLGGSGWLGSLREGIRAVFGVGGTPGNVVTTKLRDLAVLLVLGGLVLVSVLASSALTAGADWVAARLGFAIPAVLVAVGGLALGAAGHSATMVVLLRGLSALSLPWRQIRQGALLGGVVLAVMTYFAGQLVALGVRNPLFGALVGVVGLLFWLNLVAKVVLLAAAWTAEGVESHPESPVSVDGAADPAQER
jgi:membrane protein